MHAGVDLGMPLLGLRNAEQRVDLGKHALQRAARAQRFEVDVGTLRRQRFDGFLPDAFRAQCLHLAGRDDLLHQLQRLGRDREAERREARGEARDAQHAQRVFAESRRDVAQHARRQDRRGPTKDR